MAVYQQWHIDLSYINIRRDILLPVQHFGLLQSLHRELGSAGVDDRGGHRGHLGARQEASSGGEASDHLRQRAAIDCQRFQGVHSDLGHDPHQNFTPLSPIEWKNRTLAQIAQRRVHRAGNAIVAGRCAASVEDYVEHYNNVRLNSAIGYITPKAILAGRQQEIHAERDRKLEAARTASDSSAAARAKMGPIRQFGRSGYR